MSSPPSSSPSGPSILRGRRCEGAGYRPSTSTRFCRSRHCLPDTGGPRRFWYVCTQEKPQVTPLPRNPLPYSMYVRSVSDSVFSGAAGERDRHARENERVSLRNEENHVLIGFTQRKENLSEHSVILRKPCESKDLRISLSFAVHSVPRSLDSASPPSG